MAAMFFHVNPTYGVLPYSIIKTEEWGRDLQGKANFHIMKSLYQSRYRSSCACVPNKVQRSILTKLMEDTVPF